MADYEGLDIDERFVTIDDELTDEEIAEILEEMGLTEEGLLASGAGLTEFHYGGGHDQKSHGNWAGGGGKGVDDLPASERKVLAGIANSGTREAVGRMLVNRRAIEPKYTGMLKEIAKGVGGKVAGLEHKYKTADGVVDKIKRYMGSKGIDEEAAIGKIKDSLRYTLVFDPDTYVDGVKSAVQRFADEGGVTWTEIESYWSPGDDYNGINTTFRDEKTGLELELQFHTPETYRIKNSKGHRDDYEAFRKYPPNSKEARDKFFSMRDRFDNIDRPEGATSICENLPPGVNCVSTRRDAPVVASASASGADRIPVNTLEEMLSLIEAGVASREDWEDFVDGITGMGPVWRGWIYPNKPGVRKEQLTARVKAFHAEHDQSSHGNWADGGGEGGEIEGEYQPDPDYLHPYLDARKPNPYKPLNDRHAAAVDRLRRRPSEGRKMVDGEMEDDTIKTSARLDERIAKRYPEEEVTATAAALGVGVVEVPVDSVIATKRHLKRDSVAKVMNRLVDPAGPFAKPGDYIPVAIRVDDSGDLYLSDGHHRLEGYRVLQDGTGTMPVRIVDSKDIERERERRR